MNLLTKPFEFRMLERHRGVAQPGSALGSGPRGQEFKSPLPDQNLNEVQVVAKIGIIAKFS